MIKEDVLHHWQFVIISEPYLRLPAYSVFPCSSLCSALQSVNRFSSSFSSYKQRTTYFFCKYLIILPSLSHAKYFPPHFAISQHEKIIGQGISFKSRSINTRQYKLYKKTLLHNFSAGEQLSGEETLFSELATKEWTVATAAMSLPSKIWQEDITGNEFNTTTASKDVLSK